MRRLTKILLLAAITCCVSLQAQPNTALFPRLSLTGGGYGGDFNSSLQLNPHSAEGSGTEIDFERDLGVKASQNMLHFTAAWRPLDRHQFNVGFYSSKREGSRVIDRDIIFGDETFPVNGEVSADIGVKFWDAGYTYWFLQSDRSGLGVQGAITGLAIRTGLSAVGSGSEAIERSERASADLPVPIVGLEGRHAFSDRLLVMGRLGTLPKLTFGSYTAQSLIGTASVEYRVANAVSFGVGYNYFSISGSVDKDRFDGDVDYTVSGPEAFIRFVVP